MRKLTLITAISFAITSPNSIADLPSQDPIDFNTLVKSNAKHPTVQVYLAEQSIKEGDINAALTHYLSAVELGMSQAAFNIAQMDINNLKDKKSITKETANKTISTIKNMAGADQKLSAFLGQYYMDNGQDNNAFKWINNSSKLGDYNSMYLLADFIMEDKGGSEEFYRKSDAATFYKVIVDKYNHPQSAIKLAKILEEGVIVKRDPDEAKKYYLIAAEKGLPEAYYNAAYLVEHRLTSHRDVKDAINLYINALGTKYSGAAHYRLYRIYQYGNNGIAIDQDLAVKHLFSSAKDGYPKANLAIGQSYFYGTNGFKINTSESIKYLNFAANGGDNQAISKLIQIYSTGERGVTIDRREVGRLKKLQNIIKHDNNG